MIDDDANGLGRFSRMAHIGRLAFRQQDEWWLAFYAMPGTMEGALPLGSILLVLVEKPERRQAFMALCQDVVADLLERVVGERPTWPTPPAPAPESER